MLIDIDFILFRNRLVRIGVSDADEYGNHIRRRHFQLFLYDIMLLVQRDTHGAGKSPGGRRREYVFDPAPDGRERIELRTVPFFNSPDRDL